jgi:hypothetical protein
MRGEMVVRLNGRLMPDRRSHSSGISNSTESWVTYRTQETLSIEVPRDPNPICSPRFVRAPH